ncbi:hypothetical protein [Agrobacterium tumefaciens]|uniref:hypothetical protein n=1 Tax=Agrobacterium tumefaciens TaxID=358 RepID=UPI001574B108|nr:hypothetical protein [Agrobacterium tumefaciens]NTD09996.1 hypothetical protein [Agrobacterium tumefaciens]
MGETRMRKFHIPLIAALIASPSVVKADAVIDDPIAYKVIVRNVSTILKWGSWLEECVGDPRNKDYLQALERTQVYIARIAMGDGIRSDAVMKAAERASRADPSISCSSKNRTFIQQDALLSLDGLKAWSEIPISK